MHYLECIGVMPSITCRIVEVCVFRFRNDRPEYLLLRRSLDERIYPDLWQLVSGTIGDGERAVDAALRECKEETALSPKKFWVVPYVNSFYDPEYDAVNLSPFFAAQVNPHEEPSLSAEHRTYEWLPYEQARQRIVWPGQREGLDVAHMYIVRGEQAGKLTMLKE